MVAIGSDEWQAILNRVRTDHPNLVRNWFDQLRCLGLMHGVLEVRCANGPQQRYLGEHCIRPFSEAAQAETGLLVSVKFNAESTRSNDAGGERGTFGEAGAAENPYLVSLNPEYSFEQFVTGPCNRLAQAACVAVGESPGEAYNPLFLHSRAGLGKTHLMQAICQRARHTHPHLRILYLTCEGFMNHFIEAVERGSLHEFRYRYRHVDLLLIDDIQFLAERERSQEEFFHTFNTLYQARKQLVLSADSSPREIPSLEERLISRFCWGLVARIDSPCVETRMAIVQKKARRRKIVLPDEVVSFIATRINSNARELEGALTVVDALSQQLGRPADLRIAKEAIGDLSSSQRSVSIPDILTAVTEYYNVKKADLQGKRRHKSIAFPRQLCMFLARELTSSSLEEIGGFFGGRDHTTVLHAARLIGRLRDSDARISSTLSTLKDRVLKSSLR